MHKLKRGFKIGGQSGGKQYTIYFCYKSEYFGILFKQIQKYVY